MVLSAEQQLDVRDLAAPEPLQQILAVLTSLGDGKYLHVIHRREADCLFRMLGDLGYDHKSQTGPESRVDIWIWRQNDNVAKLAAEQAAAPE